MFKVPVYYHITTTGERGKMHMKVNFNLFASYYLLQIFALRNTKKH